MEWKHQFYKDVDPGTDAEFKKMLMENLDDLDVMKYIRSCFTIAGMIFPPCDPILVKKMRQQVSASAHRDGDGDGYGDGDGDGDGDEDGYGGDGGGCDGETPRLEYGADCDYEPDHESDEERAEPVASSGALERGSMRSQRHAATAATLMNREILRSQVRIQFHHQELRFFG